MQAVTPENALMFARVGGFVGVMSITRSARMFANADVPILVTSEGIVISRKSDSYVSPLFPLLVMFVGRVSSVADESVCSAFAAI